MPLWRWPIAIHVADLADLNEVFEDSTMALRTPKDRCSDSGVLSAPKSRDSLRLRRRFYRSTKNRAIFRGPKMRDSSAKKIASESRFLLRRKWVKMVLAAEFLAIPSSAVKIASERRGAILVHSGGVHMQHRDQMQDPTLWQGNKLIIGNDMKTCNELESGTCRVTTSEKKRRRIKICKVSGCLIENDFQS